MRRLSPSSTLPVAMASSRSMAPNSCSSVTLRGTLTTFFPGSMPHTERARAVFPVPDRPLIRTAFMCGFTAAHSNAVLAVSFP